MPDSPEEIHHPDGRIEHPHVHREETDASLTPIVMILIGAGGFALVIHLLIWAFMLGWRDHEAAVKKSSFPLAPPPPVNANALSPLPPGQPRLEQEDRLAGIETPNINERFSIKEKVLNSYDLTENKEDRGFVHIPIAEAMELRADKDNKKFALPHRAAPPADNAWRADGLYDSGESNSGREFRGKPR